MKWALSFFLLMLFVFFDGNEFFNPFNLEGNEGLILYQLRLSRTVLAFLVGGILALCGHTYQLLFKNDLASPFTLGVASSSSLGATLVIFWGLSSYVALASLVFSLLPAFALFYLLNQKSGFSSTKVLLAGVIISYLCSSFVVLIQVLSPGESLREILFWLLGDLNIVGHDALYVLVPSTILYLLLYQRQATSLVKVSVGEVFATNLGVDIKKTYRYYILITTVMIALCVSVCGPIGFVGIIIPHLVRMLLDKRVDKMTGDIFLYGGLFLAFCEYCAQTLLVTFHIPVGVITSLVGAPFFIYILLRFNFR